MCVYNILIPPPYRPILYWLERQLKYKFFIVNRQPNIFGTVHDVLSLCASCGYDRPYFFHRRLSTFASLHSEYLCRTISIHDNTISKLSKIYILLYENLLCDFICFNIFHNNIVRYKKIIIKRLTTAVAGI